MPKPDTACHKASPQPPLRKGEKNSCCKPGACLVQNLPLFQHVAEKDWQRFQQLATVRTYQRENILFYQGNRPLGLYFICSGRVKIAKEDCGGRSQIVRIVQAPDLLGDRAFFAGKSYACTGEVMDAAQICFLETCHFWEIFGQNVGMLRLLTERFSRELGSTEEYMSCIAACTVLARMATHLLRSWKHPTCPRTFKDKFMLTESRTELAHLLGTTPEAVSRALADLCSKRLIAVRGRNVSILNEERLCQAACLPVD
jgi:CRP/FNR family transcriptional regulator